jgi:proline dehydrogenase
MSKFSTNETINRSIDRAQARRQMVRDFVQSKLDECDRTGTDKFAYMTGYLESILGSCAQAESIAEMRRVFAYSGVKL